MTTYPFPFRAEDLPGGAFWVRAGSDGWDFRAARRRSDGSKEFLLDDPADPDRNEDWICHRRAIYAAADGVVYASWRNAPEHPRPGVLHPGRANLPQTIPRSGNFVAVLGDDGHTYVYAHLAPGSVPSSLCPFDDEFVADANDKVATDIPNRKAIVGTLIPAGQRPRVKRGQFLGLVGNSGASSNPHHHWHQRNEDNEVERFKMDRAWKATLANPDQWTKFNGQIVDDEDDDVMIHASPLLRRGHVDGGSFTKLAMHFTRSRRVVTAVRLTNGNLKLISWGITDAGQLVRRGDETAGAITDVTIAEPRSDIVVTAVRLANGQLKLISWRIESDGTPTRCDDETAGPITDVALVTVKTGVVVTAVRLTNGNLKLIAWTVSPNGTIARRGDINAGAITAVHTTRTPAVDDGLVTAVRLADGRLKLIAWETSGNGATITRRGDATTGEVSDVAIVHRGSGGKFLLTAARDGNGKLLMQSWEVGSGGDLIKELATAQAGTVSEFDIAGIASPNRSAVVAGRTATGRLKLISWELDADGKQICRLAGALAGEASALSLAATSHEDRDYFVVACKLSDGNLRLINWEANLLL